MDLNQLANLGEFLGGIGVIASLIYLAREIRSSTKAAHNTAYHEAISQISEGLREMMNDRWNDLAQRPAEELDDVEQVQCAWPPGAVLYGTEILFHLNQQGHIDSRMWQNVEKNWYPVLQSPFFLDALQERPGPLSQELLVAINRSARDSQ